MEVRLKSRNGGLLGSGDAGRCVSRFGVHGRRMMEVTDPLATGNMDIDSLKPERSETLTVMDMIWERGGREKGKGLQPPAEEEDRRVLVSAHIMGSLVAERPETFTVADNVWE